MRTALNQRTATRLLTLAVMAVSTFAPSALQLYRCEAMGQTMSAPCCPDEEATGAPHESAQFEPERCCTGFSVAVSRDAVELTRAPHGSLPLDAAGPLRAPSVAVAPPTRVLAWTRAQFDSGPPILLRTRSLLI